MKKNKRLEKLLESNKKKEKNLSRKLGNQKRVWDKQTLEKATIWID